MNVVADSSVQEGQPPAPSKPTSVAPHNTMQTSGANGTGNYTMNPPYQQAPFIMPVPAVDTSAQDVLQSLGISLDHLFQDSPTSTGSNSSNPPQTGGIKAPTRQDSASQPFATDSVFDDLFGSGDFFGQELWTTGNF